MGGERQEEDREKLKEAVEEEEEKNWEEVEEGDEEEEKEHKEKEVDKCGLFIAIATAPRGASIWSILFKYFYIQQNPTFYFVTCIPIPDYIISYVDQSFVSISTHYVTDISMLENSTTEC